MVIDDIENPNPNTTDTLPPPQTTVPLPIPPPIAPIPRPPPRPQNGDVSKPTKSSDEEEPENNDSSPEYEISEESKLFREKQEKAKQDFLLKQRAAALSVPTNDKSVRSRLRRLSEPITLFGEREMERRERLRMIMAKLDSEGQLETLMRVFEEEGMEDGGGEEEEGEAVQYPFYTEGSKELLKARYEIAKSSVLRAAERLGRARRKRDDPDEDFDGEVNWALENAKSFGLDCSEIGDDRRSLAARFRVMACFLLLGMCFFWFVL